MKIKVGQVRKVVQEVLKESIDDEISALQAEYDAAVSDYQELNSQINQMRRDPKNKVINPEWEKVKPTFIDDDLPKFIPGPEMQDFIDQRNAIVQQASEIKNNLLHLKSQKNQNKFNALPHEQQERLKADAMHKAVYGGNVNNPRGLGS